MLNSVSISSSHSSVVDVEQHRAAGVGVVGDVDLAAGQPPDQEGVDGAEEQLAALRPVAGALDVVEQPFDLRAGEVGVDHQARSCSRILSVQPLAFSSSQ